MWLWVVLFFIVCIYISFKKIEICNYWKKKNVPQVKPLPILGNLAPLLFGKYSMVELLQELYNAHPNKRYIGIHQFDQPTLFIKDPDLIREITVKNFDTFPEHDTLVTEEADPMLAKCLVFMKGGSKWRSLRYTLSPAFTSNKLKMMFNLMSTCTMQFMDHFDRPDALIKLDLKDAFSRYTNDLIASTVFGVSCNSFENKLSDIYVMANKGLDSLRGLKLFINSICPTIVRILKIRIVPKNVEVFFRNIIKENIEMRKKTKFIRPDMLHLLLEAQKGQLQVDEETNQTGLTFANIQYSPAEIPQKIEKSIISNDDILAQAFVFFIAGFDTVSSALCFTAYELAINPSIQKKLQDEVDSVVESSNGKPVTYEALLQMKYMDCVISETLRKWPPITLNDRKAVKSFIIEPKVPEEKSVQLEIGTVCWIPIYSIHRDPKNYPNPDTFDPDRFSNENKHKIGQFTYLPFGSGPKTCLGSRFAVIETKLVLFNILTKFNIVPIDETAIPIPLTGKTFLLEAKAGLLVGLQTRKLRAI